MTRWLVTLLSVATCILGLNVAEPADTFVIQIPEPQESFRMEDLTPEQRAACSEFLRLAGEYRKPAFEALQQSGAFPIDSKRMSEAQVVALLGVPDSKGESLLTYSLGFGDGGGHSLGIEFIDGRAAMIWFSKTL